MDNYTFTFKERTVPTLKVVFSTGEEVDLTEPDVKTAEEALKTYNQLTDGKPNMDACWMLAAVAISFNKQNRVFAVNELRDLGGSDDEIVRFLLTYTDYLIGIAESKN